LESEAVMGSDVLQIAISLAILISAGLALVCDYLRHEQLKAAVAAGARKQQSPLHPALRKVSSKNPEAKTHFSDGDCTAPG
jgi:hypothetical protein